MQVQCKLLHQEEVGNGRSQNGDDPQIGGGSFWGWWWKSLLWCMSQYHKSSLACAHRSAAHMIALLVFGLDEKSFIQTSRLVLIGEWESGIYWSFSLRAWKDVVNDENRVLDKSYHCKNTNSTPVFSASSYRKAKQSWLTLDGQCIAFGMSSQINIAEAITSSCCICCGFECFVFPI